MVAQQPAPPAPAQAELLPPEQLDTLVAPIALYPDALLSQVLVAATYPQEIVEAGQWLRQNGNLHGTQLVDAARQQSWDPSIQALVVFPDVIKSMNADMRWTTDLGNAFLAQQADVMDAVQRMRAQAQTAGKLRSNAQQTVTTEMQGDQSAIEIQPANPEVVYVPQYNPAYVWGPPAYGYYPEWDYPYYGYGYGYGGGIYIGGFFGGLGWGGWGWGPNWYHHSIYQNSFFFSRYGFGGRGYRGGGNWAHNPSHRLGVPYANGRLNGRYGGFSAARGGSNAGRFGGQAYGARQNNSGLRGGATQGSGWSRFGQRGAISPGAQRSYGSGPANGNRSGSRMSPSYGGGNRSVPSYRSSPAYGNRSGSRMSPAYGGGNRSVPSYRSSPAYGGGNRSVPSYRSSPSYGGGNRSTPSLRSSPSNGGGNRSMPSYRSSPSNGGGGGYASGRSSGGGGGSNRSGGSSRGGGGGGNRGGGGSSHGGGNRR